MRGLLFFNQLYYAELLGRFAAELQKIQPHLAKNKVLFHLDNAPAHTSALAKAKLVELGYELLPHPPYSSDLAPSDFFLFPNLKKSLAGQKLASNEEVVAAIEAYFADLEKTYFSDGLKKLEHRWVKCIELKGDCVFQNVRFSFGGLSLAKLKPVSKKKVATHPIKPKFSKNCPKEL